MNKLSQAIEQAVEDCKYNGSGDIKISENVAIQTEWQSWEADSNYDVITVFIKEDGILIFQYQLSETKELA